MAELIIEAGRTEGQYWRDLWGYRELFYVLSWRDIMVRYKQTAVGILWALIQPFLTTVVMTLVFQYFAKVPSIGTAPYALMVYAGTLPWQFFSTALGNSSNSVLSSGALISKIYFPRLIIPASAVVTALADLGFQLLLLIPMMAIFHVWPTWRLCFIPFFVLLVFSITLGPGLFFTALAVQFRDFRHILPFMITLGFYATPVAYPIGLLSKNHPVLYSLVCLNPIVGVIDGFRWCILGGQATLDWRSIVLSINTSIFFLLLGIWYFRRTERSFADMI